MQRIFELVPRKRVEAFLSRHSEALGVPILLLGPDKGVLLASQAGAPTEKLSLRELRLEDLTIGYVAAAEETPAELLDLVASNLSEVIGASQEIESLSAEVARNYEELSNLWRISERLGAGLDVDTICQVLAEEVMAICPSTNLSVMLLSEPFNQHSAIGSGGGEDSASEKPGPPILFPKVSLGADSSRASTMVLAADRGLVGHAFRTKQALTVCDVSSDSRFEGLPYPVSRILIVPLVVEGLGVGAVVASDKLDGQEYFSTEIKLIRSIASECAVSIKKALLFNEVQTLLFDVSEALSLAVEAKDSYTYGHSRRVSRMASDIARKMGLPAEEVGRIRLAALLHDIGKIGTPEVILHKDAKLDGGETERVQEHPLIGSRMIEHIRKLSEISRWIRHHHERFDGTGYPSGLRGEQIPLPSRIIAVADFYDAITSDRPYRKALPSEEALEMMRGLSGSHFDPAVFDCFQKEVFRLPAV